MNSRNIYALYDEYANGLYKSKSGTTQTAKDITLKINIFLRSLSADEKRAVRDTLDGWIDHGTSLQKSFALEICNCRELRG